MCAWRRLAKKSMANQCKQHTLKSTFNRLQSCRWQYRFIFICLAVFCLPNLRNDAEIPQNSPKTRAYNSLGSSKVIDLGANRKCICNFLLLSNFGASAKSATLSSYWCIMLEIDLFFPPHPSLMPRSRGTPWDINVIYTPLKSTFNGLQFRRWQHGSIFICLTLLSPKSAKCHENSKEFELTAFNVIDLGVNRKHLCDFLLVNR